MVNKKLGKGLSSLLGNKKNIQDNSPDNKGLLLIPLEKIFRDEDQPRKEFDKEKIKELAQSIKKNGLIQPLILNKKAGKPYISIIGQTKKTFNKKFKKKKSKISLSISDEKKYAVAFVTISLWRKIEFFT